MIDKDILVLIPARGGSKGVPKKNIKLLGGKPLILYTLDFAAKFFGKEDICVSTDSWEIKKNVETLGFDVPFLRPAELATDFSGTREVLLHAIEFYRAEGINYKYILLLQPTTPIREARVLHEIEVLKASRGQFDMIVSVRESKSNPYFNLFEDTSEGFLKPCKEGDFVRRQDCPKIYEYDGAFYLIRIDSLVLHEMRNFSHIMKILNDKTFFNVDIDTMEDWQKAEDLLKKHKVNI